MSESEYIVLTQARDNYTRVPQQKADSNNKTVQNFNLFYAFIMNGNEEPSPFLFTSVRFGSASVQSTLLVRERICESVAADK